MFNADYSAEYAEFIINNSFGNRVICNGDSLLEAMEQGYMYQEFLETIKQTEVA